MQIRFNWVSGTRSVFGIHIRIEKVEKMALWKEKKFLALKVVLFSHGLLEASLKVGKFFIEV